MDNCKELKVSKNTDPKKLAGTLKHYLGKGMNCSIQALGIKPISIAVKSLALLTTMFNVPYSCNMQYFNYSSDTGTVAGIQFSVYP